MQSQAEGVEAMIAVNERVVLGVQPRLNQLVKVEHLKIMHQDGIAWIHVCVCMRERERERERVRVHTM